MGAHRGVTRGGLYFFRSSSRNRSTVSHSLMVVESGVAEPQGEGTFLPSGRR